MIFISVTEQAAASTEIAFGQMAQCQHERLLIINVQNSSLYAC